MNYCKAKFYLTSIKYDHKRELSLHVCTVAHIFEFNYRYFGYILQQGD